MTSDVCNMNVFRERLALPATADVIPLSTLLIQKGFEHLDFPLYELFLHERTWNRGRLWKQSPREETLNSRTVKPGGWIKGASVTRMGWITSTVILRICSSRVCTIVDPRGVVISCWTVPSRQWWTVGSHHCGAGAEGCSGTLEGCWKPQGHTIMKAEGCR